MIRACVECGTEFTVHPQGTTKKFCTAQCRRNSPRLVEQRRVWMQNRLDTDPEFKEIRRQNKNDSKKRDLRRRLLYNARSNSAGGTRVECTITVDDIIIPDPPICPVLGIEMKCNVGTGGYSPDSFSLDRFDNDKGYIPGNVVVISRRANVLKSNATAEEIYKVYQYMLNGVDPK